MAGETRIEIAIGGHVLPGVLDGSATGKALVARLPLKLRLSRWGDEYYGSLVPALKVPVAPDAREDVAVGELAYWLPGNALCLFFGPTPASTGDAPRAASPVNPAGRVTGDLSVLKKLASSVNAEVRRAG